MSASKNTGEKPVVTLLPPHYHNEWVYGRFIDELGNLGIRAHAPHLEISDPDMTRDDHAAVMLSAEEEIGAENYIRAGASWGGDIIYRQLGAHVSKLIFMGTPLRPVIQRRRAVLQRIGVTLPENSVEPVNDPNLPYAAYVRGEKEKGFNRHDLGDVFYKRIADTTLRAAATEKLEPHPHTNEDPAEDENAVLPDGIEKHFIAFYNDEILNYDDEVKTAKFFNMDYTPLATGHFAMLEDPKLLAELFAEIIEGRINRVRWSAALYEDRRRKLLASPPIVIGKTALSALYA